MTRNGNKLLREHEPISILILGTNTMIIMTLNPDTRKTTLVSIPRDIEVNFPNYPQYSPAKINSTYTYGGGVDVKSPLTILNKSFLDSISDQVKTDLTLNDLCILTLSYRNVNQHFDSTHVQSESGLDFQIVSQTERERIANLVWNSLKQ